MSRVLALIATIPARRRSCERLLGELARQSRPPDGLVLVLDGYGDGPYPVMTLPIVLEHRTPAPSGAGTRWRVVERELEQAVAPAALTVDDIIVCLDDDFMLVQAPKLVAALADTVQYGGAAAAAMGRDRAGHQAPPGDRGRGEIIYAAGCGLAMRAGELVGVSELAAAVKAGAGVDPLGVGGDDDALVSAHLWKRGTRILHTATGNIFSAPGTRASSQTAAKRGRDPNAQKSAIARVTGWPWPGEYQAGRGIPSRRVGLAHNLKGQR